MILLLMFGRINLIMIFLSGGFLLMWRILTDEEDILLLSGGFLFLMKVILLRKMDSIRRIFYFIMEDILLLLGILYKLK